MELSVTSVFWGERMGFHPTAAGILIEILAGTSGKIHVGAIEGACGRLCSDACDQQGQGGQKMFESHGMSIGIVVIFEGKCLLVLKGNS